MTTPIVPTVTNELIAELEAAANAATPGPWKYETDEDSCFGAVFVSPDTAQYSPPICRIDHDCTAEYVAFANPATILALLSHIAALKQQLATASVDAERFRLFAETVVAECSGHEMTAQQAALFGCMNSVASVSMDGLIEMFDAALAIAAD